MTSHVSGKLIKACVIGDPVAHSRSPLIHGYWLKQHNIPGSYERVQVKPDDLAAFIKDLADNGYAGCNVTLPHKEAAVAHIAHFDERVHRCGALNTIYMEKGELRATTTDGIGFCANVEDHCPGFAFESATVLIYGAGGSARPITDELLRRGVAKILITNRTLSRAEELAAHFGAPVIALKHEDVAEHLSKTHLLINCTSLGMKGEGAIDLDLALLPKSAVVADIVYVPLVTDFLQRARDLNLRSVPGLGMLLHQAVPGFEKWFGIRPEVTKPLHDLIARDIDPAFKPLKVIGLTGGIASGKSEVAKIIASEGIPVLDADKVVHALYEDGTAAAQLKKDFPEACGGKLVDRAVLSSIISGDPEKLALLERLIHPLVRAREIAFLAECRARGDKVAVLEIPLLVEADRARDCDHVIAVEAPNHLRRTRALERPGMTEEKLARIMGRQVTDLDRRKKASHVIENSGSKLALQAQALHLIRKLRDA
jgi:shikimate dehydrogenase